MKYRVLAIALFVGATFVALAPATVQAGGGKMLQQCLADRASEPDQRLVRSECMWEYHEYMASYGR